MPASAEKMELKRVTVLFLKTLKSKKDVILFAEQLKNLKCSRLIISDYHYKGLTDFSKKPVKSLAHNMDFGGFQDYS